MPKIIYLTIPAYCQQGGVESLYQLSDGLVRAGFDCKVLYVVDDTYEIIENGQPDKFKHYKAFSAANIDDKEDNLIIVPEVWTQALSKFKKIKKCIWWLSVDNNLNSVKGNFSEWDNKNIIHLFQSYYSQQYVNSRGCTGFMIRDYINPKNYNDLNLERKNIACYNPQKVSSSTQNAINFLKEKNYEVLPLQGFSAKELLEKFNEIKIYFDFGHHPGRDRLPREAALNGCVIVTNMKGSAAYYEDVTIAPKYKQIDFNGSLFEDIMSNFSEHKKAQEDYIAEIKKDEQNVVSDLKNIFSRIL